MRKLIEYMPPFLKGVREFNEIFDAEDIEIQNLNSNMNLILTETIVSTARSFGLDRYEKIYGIENASTNVEARRTAILTKINSKVPFTYKWLYNQLKEIFGENGFKINIDYNNYTIEIIIYSICSEVADIFIESLYYKIPANMEQSYKLIAKCDYKVGAILVQKESDTLVIDTSIIKEKEEINGNDNIGMVVAQIEQDKLMIDNSIMKETTSISQKQDIGGVIVQKENNTLNINNNYIASNVIQKENEMIKVDNSIISEKLDIKNNNYIASRIIQKENINLKEE